MKLKGSGGNGVIKEILDPDPANLRLAGTVTGTSSLGTGKGSKQKLASTPIALNLPIGADRSWTLEMNIVPAGTRYTGDGSAAICGCKTYPIIITGAYNTRSDSSKLQLKGQGGPVNLAIIAGYQNGGDSVPEPQGQDARPEPAHTIAGAG
jgi:hypothetical protein